jgi:hypothetical protein
MEEGTEVRGKTLGILELENDPVRHRGFLAGPDTFDFPVRRLTVTGAPARNVVDGDRSVKAAYVECARKLESEGVSAIIANCGFTGVFQADVAAAVSVPVALSSLLLAPMVARLLPPGRKLGILTYDSKKLSEDHLLAAGWTLGRGAFAVAGIEGSESWYEFAKPSPNIDVPSLVADVLKAAKSLLASEPSVGAFVFECSGFPVAADTVRRETGLPVADYLMLAKGLFEMSAPAKANFH